MMKLNIQLFASGTIDGSSTASNADCRIVWTSTPNNEENYSVVTVEAQLYKSGSSSTTGTFSGVVNVNDTEYAISKKFSPYRWGNWVTVGTVSVTIPHNSDGTKSINISTYFSNSGTSMAGSYSIPYPTYVTLDTIPRGSTFIANQWDKDTQRQMNSTLSIPATQHVAGVYHKLEARFMNNGTETTICTRTGVSIVNNAISFTFSSGELSTVYNLMPNQTTHYIRMFLYTYTDSAYQNQLGDVSIIWWTGSIPSSVIPSLSIGTITEGNNTVASLGWNVFVQNKSQLSIPLTGTGAYGSTISSYSTTVNGSTYPGANVTTNIINTTGSLTISGTTTDSRGRSGSASKTVNIVAYSNPQITTAIAARCDSLGNDDDNGTYLKYSFDGSISTISNNNAHTFRIGYKVKGTSTYTYTNIDTTNYSITKSNQVLNLNLDTTKTYTIVFEAVDSFTTTSIERQIDTGKDLMNFNASGKSMAIGKVSEASSSDELLEIALATEISETLNVDGTFKLKGFEALYHDSTWGHTVLACDNANNIYLRPNGRTSATGQAYVEANGKLTASGEVVGKLGSGYGQLRAVATNYGFFIRNDDGSTYFMLTDSGDANGSWNSLRPIYINNASGRVGMSNGLNVSDVLTLNNRSVATMKELYSNTSGATSVDIGEDTGNYNFYVISWGVAIDEKRTDIFIPNFGNNRLDQFATTSYYFIYNFTNSGNNISMSYITGAGWGNNGKMFKVIGVKF